MGVTDTAVVIPYKPATINIRTWNIAWRITIAYWPWILAYKATDIPIAWNIACRIGVGDDRIRIASSIGVWIITRAESVFSYKATDIVSRA